MIRYLSLLLVSCSTLLAQTPKLTLELITSGFYRPCDVAVVSDTKFLVAQTDGKIKLVKNGQLTTFLDIGSKIDDPDWGGIFGFTLHPQYETNGYIYVHYSRKGDMASLIARFTRNSANPDVADLSSEVSILTIPYPNGGHRSGRVGFGPDGYLYITTGDSSPGARNSIGDPAKLAQNLTDLHGKLLRIDVNGGFPYAIPPTNPFASPADGVPDELYALGLRNPWRWSFDRQTGDFWLGDVGQDDWEELNFTSANAPAPQNYGWPCYEGSHAYNTTCPPGSTYHMPLLDYAGYSSGKDASITGGFVYRGSKYPALRGWYVYADYARGTYWTLKRETNGMFQNTQQSIPISSSPVSFGEGPDGELYVVSLLDGKLYRINVYTIQSVQNGNWNSPSTWNCNCVPTSADVVTVSTGHTVTINQASLANLLMLTGKVQISSGGKLTF
ncbi:PQQ-dependent sugar dehydrogenase [Spirosoma sp.]|uniref:PQQ-dependent sugar dehydrogenase n=1 Tax=Spirosoma sp. TaxID=1899569 RepID=UPI002608F795|nr:PQQ-dependent sugar dehydrogenase [Spirosoma sp.]MCX6216132.1 PQQ-dependent sugar dehydrogenase [Spirosoma sp.]